MRRATLTLAIALVAAGGWWAFVRPPSIKSLTAGPSMVAVSLPESLTPLEQAGAVAFTAHCADCHGINGAGRDGIAPPLIHKIYEPSHHGDMSFQLAMIQGVRAHHWSFGDMSAVIGLAPADVEPIIAYVRAVQRANGIN